MVRFVWIILVLSVHLTWGQGTELELYHRARLSLQNDAYDLAIRDFSYVLQLNEEHEEALLFRGIAHLEKKEAQQAYTDLSKQIEVHGGNGRVYFYRAQAALLLGERAMALDDIKIALIYEPKEAAFHKRMARVLITLKEYEEALEAINKAMRFDTQGLAYLYDRIEIWLGLGEAEYALRDCAYLARSTPQDPRVYTVRAAIYFQEGDRRAACKDWGAAAAMGDNSVLSLIQQFCDQRMEYSRNK